MELNAEQIIKALECCTVGIGTECEKCPYMLTPFCNDKLKKDILAYINELTEVNERLRAEEKQSQILIKTLHDKLDEGYVKFVDEERADTVKKMRERLQMYFGTYVIGYKIALYDVLRVIDQIAKEMLEGG